MKDLKIQGGMVAEIPIVLSCVWEFVYLLGYVGKGIMGVRLSEHERWNDIFYRPGFRRHVYVERFEFWGANKFVLNVVVRDVKVDI